MLMTQIPICAGKWAVEEEEGAGHGVQGKAEEKDCRYLGPDSEVYLIICLKLNR